MPPARPHARRAALALLLLAAASAFALPLGTSDTALNPIDANDAAELAREAAVLAARGAREAAEEVAEAARDRDAYGRVRDREAGDAVEDAPDARAAVPGAGAAPTATARRARWPRDPAPPATPVQPKGSAADPKRTASPSADPAGTDASRESEEDGPPFNSAFPSPIGRGVPRSGGPVGSLSLSVALPEMYDPASGGRGVAPRAAATARVSFAARWSAAAAARRLGFDDDMQAAENERPEPRRESLLIAGLDPKAPNTLGARLDDIPVVKATPIEVLASAVTPASQVDASRVVIRSGTPPATLAFAAVSAVDQPMRRFRPPDQSLCVGNGVVITGNNLVLRTWDADTGAPLEGPVGQPEFFNLTGNFSDPTCIFDAADTGRFFVSIFRFNEPSPGKFSQYIVAVSKTGNPADGFLGPYIFSNDGLDPKGVPLPGLEKCAGSKGSGGDPDVDAGCLGDYPSVGLDQHSLWAGFNLFKQDEGYAGSLMLAVSKADLVGGRAASPAHAVYSNWNQELAYTVQPSQTQAGTPHDTGRGGTIYLVSTAPVVQNEPNVPALAAWAATNTSALAAPDFPASGIPVISGVALIDTPAYRDPGVFKAKKLGVLQPAPGFPLDGGDARTLQHVLSGGVLWTATQTVMYVGAAAGGNLTIGPAYFAVLPRWRGSDYAPRLLTAGYVGAPGRFIGRPAITASKTGTAFIAAYMSGSDFHMSPVVIEVDLLAGPRRIIVPVRAPGALQPSAVDRLWRAGDAAGGGTLRVGDYSAACLDERGHAWLASEWAGGVPSPLCVEAFGASKCPNWSTFVTRVDLGSSGGPTAAARAPPEGGVGGGGSAGPAPFVAGVAGPSAPGSSLDSVKPGGGATVARFAPDDVPEEGAGGGRDRSVKRPATKSAAGTP